jgi:hypothetical protein
MSFDLAGYVDVAERIRMFKEKYPNGTLQPANLDKPYEIVAVAERTFIVYVAAAYREASDQRPGVGIAWEPFPGKTPYTRDSELMNAETSAWGRAIIAALAADTQKIASADEVRNRREHPADGEDAKVIPLVAVPFMGAEQPVARSREKMIADANQKSQVAKQKATATSVDISDAQAKLLTKLAGERGVDLVAFLCDETGRQVTDVNQLTKREASTIISNLMNRKDRP